MKLKEISNTTQRGRALIEAYDRTRENKPNNEADNLFKVYKSFSRDKYDAFNKCVAFKSELNGYGAYFTGAGSYYFSYAFLIKENGAKYLIYITYANAYKVLYNGGF